MRGAKMLYEIQTQLEFPCGSPASNGDGRDSSFANVAAKESETYRIMEALVREYLNRTQRRN